MARTTYPDPEAETEYQNIVGRSSEVSAKIPEPWDGTQKGTDYGVSVDGQNYDAHPDRGPANRTWERKNLKRK